VAVPSLPTTTPAARLARGWLRADEAGGNAAAEGRRHGVAGAGHVIDLERPGGLVVGRLALLQQGHALFAAGDQQGLQVQLGAQGLAPGDQRGLVRAGADHGLELGQVGLDDGGAAVAGKVGALRVHHHRHAPGPGQGDQGRHVGEGALGVVGQHQHVDALQVGGQGIAPPGGVAGVETLLEIQADQLLVARDDPQLGDRRRVGKALEGAIDAPGGQTLAEQAAGLVVAHQADDPRPGAQGGGVEGHVAGAAGAHFVVLTCTTGTGASGEMRAVAPCQ
jgi:hypothetical protein